MDIDLDKLEQAAKASLQHSKNIGSDWWGDDELATMASDEDSAFIAAASPQLVLELISRLRAAEENYQAATLRANANAEMLKALQSQSPARPMGCVLTKLAKDVHSEVASEVEWWSTGFYEPKDLQQSISAIVERYTSQPPAAASTAPESGSQQ